MTGPLIFAVDPGSVRCAFAVLRGEGSRVRYLGAGSFASELDPFTGALDGAILDAGREANVVVAVERPLGFVHEHVRSAQLMATAGAAYALDWVARDRGYFTVVMSAGDVRKLLIGKTKLAFGRAEKKGDMDRTIKSVLPHFVDGMPARSNEHARDAMLLGVAANWRWLARSKRAA